MRVQDMIDSIKDNLGSRNSGRIGTRDVDTVVYEALNLAVPHCCQEAQPDYYNRTASFPLLNEIWDDTVDPPVMTQAAVREYPMPTVDVDGIAVRIKTIYGYRLVRSGNTEAAIKQLNYSDFIQRTQNYSLKYTGTPSYFSLWGKNNTIHFDYFPSEPMEFIMYVEVYPELITTTGAQSPLPLPDQWNIVIEAYATKHCYLKMQQTEMYTFWNDLYDREKRSVMRTENDKHAQGIDADSKRALITDPVLDPRARTWNS